MGTIVSEKTEFKGRPEFNKSWGNMTRKIHTENLAKPHPRRIVPYPNPMYYQPVPPEIPKEALSYKPTKRIKMLSAPVESRKNRKYSKPAGEEHFVEPAALIFTPSNRLNALSRPKTQPVATKVKDKKRPKTKKEIQKEKEKFKQSLDRRGEWLARCAVPKQYPPVERKPTHRPRFVFWGSKKVKIPERKPVGYLQISRPPLQITKEELLRHCDMLSIPMRKREKYTDMIAKKMQEKPKLVGQASPRIHELSQPKPLLPEAMLDLKFKPYKISRGAMKYQATERINILATPITKTKKIDTDVKENPFGVSKAALNAICSKRILELAKPVIKE